jgi:predicted transcriptional regulator of viral defense system
MKKTNDSKINERAHSAFLKNNGFLRASEAFSIGIHPRDLYSLRDEGFIETVSRGVFRLKSIQPLQSRELFIVATRIPSGVLCLNSALYFHKLTSKEPSQIDIALEKGTQRPKIEELAVKFVWISEPAFSDGIESHQVDGADLRVYNMEKTLADSFKFRNQIGIDTCIEALKNWSKLKTKDPTKLLTHSKNCRIEKVIRPYMEVVLS